MNPEDYPKRWGRIAAVIVVLFLLFTVLQWLF
jgi:hypothetical protein